MNGILVLSLIIAIPTIVVLLIITLLDIIEKQTEKEIRENIKILDKRMKKVEKMRKNHQKAKENK